jgi:hypothetical protein
MSRPEREPPRGIAERCSDWCVIAILAWMAAPEMWTKLISLDGAPPHFYVTQILWLSLMIEGFLKRESRSSFFWVMLAVALYAAVRAGFALDRNNWDLKFFISDLWTIQILILGFLWSRRRTLPQIASLGRITAGIIVPAAVLTMAGLYLGVVVPFDREYSDRVYTSSLWSIGFTAQFLWPIIYARRGYALTDYDPRRSISSRYLGICAWLLVPTALFIAVYTATRSLLLVSAVSYVAVRLIEPKRSTQQVVTMALVLMAFLAAGLTLATITRPKGNSVLDRFELTDVTEDGRGVELTWLFDQLGNDYISGWGLGSLFYSPIRYNGRPFEAAPHIGIVTFVLKGGFLMAAAFVLVPLSMCIRASRERTSRSRASIGCVLVYLASASLSGGWYPYQTLMFGVGIGLAARAGDRRTSSTSLPILARREVYGPIHVALDGRPS